LPDNKATVLVVVGAAQRGPELGAALRRRGYLAQVVDRGDKALEAFRAQGANAVVVALPMPDMGSKSLLRSLQKLDPSVVFIVAGTDADVLSGGDAFELGAYDYLEDAASDAGQFLAVIGAAIGSRRGDVQLRYLRNKDAPAAGWSALVGHSPALQNVAGILRQVCQRTSGGGTPTILLTGETGTGKGFVAKCVHYNSARRNHPFVEVNCAALPPTLIESELFGHERGAFTDAKTARGGLFEAADGGTLFLDEIGAVPLDLQAKLLVCIEEKRVRRIGGRQSARVDVQIIAATHENLEARAEQGSFRSDLFHRLNVVSVELPALRDRGDDALALADSFIAAICQEYGMARRTLSDDARQWIRGYAWPGNVRELRNRIERILLLVDDHVVRAEHFGSGPSSTKIRVAARQEGVEVTLPPEGVSLDALERAVISKALEECQGNVSRAARYLSISRQTLIYRMKKYSLRDGSAGEMIGNLRPPVPDRRH
jgi:DNA-binding NtrC family response regulator